jgi:hypothetical protein
MPLSRLPVHGCWCLIAAAIVAASSPTIVRAQEDVAETEGVAAPADVPPIREIPITDSDRDHWAFRPIERPAVSAVKNAAWPLSPIDCFILARLEKDGFAGSPEADRGRLLRRATFDLHGLPPSPAELAAFSADERPDAYERQIDRLLSSTAYGERWAQHWLDLARYAETDGFEHDKVRSGAWKYRDWVIAALNADLPYDEFVRQQLAGEPSVATMFCLAGPDMPDLNDQLERRHIVLNELTAMVGSVLLGLQMGCAQCHDHKYDPVSQADFYRLRGVFESAVPKLKRDVHYLSLTEQKSPPPVRFWIRGDHRRPGAELSPGFPRIASPNASETEKSPSREDFAQWLLAEQNPLARRVIANRLWLQHFGRGIFDTPSDVGLINAGPTHPELLDWLATELSRGDWSLKQMDRRIMQSATYRQAGDISPSDAQSHEKTPPYAHFPRRRLDGESIRDAMLAASGLVVRDHGGPSVMPPLPPELVGTLLKGQWIESPDEADHYRRSIYLFARRNLRYPIFEAFDRPDANASCPLRNRSTTAPQSLLLFNSEFSLLAAQHLAGEVIRDSGSDEPASWIDLLYVRTLSRSPTEGERVTITNFVQGQAQRLAAEHRATSELALPAGIDIPTDSYAAAALVDACLAIFNASEFLYID